MKEYDAYYERLTAPFRSAPGKASALRNLNRAITVLFYAAYPALLLYLSLSKSRRLLKAVLVPGISFGILSAVRRRINRPRPYETWKIDRIFYKKKTKGKSMPSRHVFCTAVIAMTFLWICPPVGIAMLAVSVLAAVIRVLGGVHYPSDVIAGFLSGIAAGLFYFI